MTRAPTLTWTHVGDLHLEEANGRQRRDRPAASVAALDRHVGDLVDHDAAFRRDTGPEVDVIDGGHDAIGPWAEHGIEGAKVGPDKNGTRW